MKKISSLVLVLIAALFVAGCGRTAVVQNYDNSQYFEQAVSITKVKNAIISGATRKGWSTKSIKDGLIEARITVKDKFVVIVSIDYDAKGYNIKYKNSLYLNYDSSSNTIHSSYIRWVNILEENINYHLARIGMAQVDNNSTVTNMPTSKVVNKKATSKIYKKDIDLAGKTIYIKGLVPY